MFSSIIFIVNNRQIVVKTYQRQRFLKRYNDIIIILFININDN